MQKAECFGQLWGAERWLHKKQRMTNNLCHPFPWRQNQIYFPRLKNKQTNKQLCPTVSLCGADFWNFMVLLNSFQKICQHYRLLASLLFGIRFFSEYLEKIATSGQSWPLQETEHICMTTVINLLCYSVYMYHTYNMYT